MYWSRRMSFFCGKGLRKTNSFPPESGRWALALILYPILADWAGTSLWHTQGILEKAAQPVLMWELSGARTRAHSSESLEINCSALTGPECVSKWAVCKNIFEMDPPPSLKWFSSWVHFSFFCYLSSVVLHPQLYFAFRLLLMPGSSWALEVESLLIQGRSCSRGSDWHII